MIKTYQGDKILKCIIDGRTLSALSKQGFFEYPIDKGHKYIDELKNPRRFDNNGKCYIIEYVDGCFFPFLFQILGHKIGFYDTETNTEVKY